MSVTNVASSLIIYYQFPLEQISFQLVVFALASFFINFLNSTDLWAVRHTHVKSALNQCAIVKFMLLQRCVLAIIYAPMFYFTLIYCVGLVKFSDQVTAQLMPGIEVVYIAVCLSTFLSIFRTSSSITKSYKKLAIFNMIFGILTFLITLISAFYFQSLLVHWHLVAILNLLCLPYIIFELRSFLKIRSSEIAVLYLLLKRRDFFNFGFLPGVTALISGIRNIVPLLIMGTTISTDSIAVFAFIRNGYELVHKLIDQTFRTLLKEALSIVIQNTKKYWIFFLAGTAIRSLIAIGVAVLLYIADKIANINLFDHLDLLAVVGLVFALGVSKNLFNIVSWKHSSGTNLAKAQIFRGLSWGVCFYLSQTFDTDFILMFLLSEMSLIFVLVILTLKLLKKTNESEFETLKTAGSPNNGEFKPDGS